MTDIVAKHFLVTGKVQGVFYRQSTLNKAKELGLTGWVRNCKDGTVEIEACGSTAALTELENWLWQGPPAAKVSNVMINNIKPFNSTDFIVL